MLNEKLQHLRNLGDELMITNERIVQSIEAVERCDIHDDSYQDEEDNLYYVQFQKEQIIRAIKATQMMKGTRNIVTTTGLERVLALFEFDAFFIYEKNAIGTSGKNYVVTHLTSGKSVKTFCDYETATEFTIEIGMKFSAIELTSTDVEQLATFTYNWRK